MSRSTYTVKPEKRSEPNQVSGPGVDQHVDQEEWLSLTQYSMDHFPEAAIWTDMESRILYVNEAACDKLGYARDELLQMKISDIDQSHPFGNYATFISLIKQRRSITFESEHITKTGRRIPVEVTTHYQKYGAQEYVISFTRDISGRKQTEDTLRQSEERYRSLVENINDMVWEMDTNFTCTYASPRTLDILGYAPAEVVGKKPFDFICPEDLSRTREALTLAIRDLRPLRLLEYGVRRKDGRAIVIETNGEPIVGPDGILAGYRGINRDVTERKEAEEALRQNEQFLSRIFDSFQDGISVLDKDLNIVRVNRVLEEWHSDMQPLKGKKCYYAYHCRGAPCTICPSLRAMQLKTMQSDIIPLYSGRGDLKKWLEIYSFPLLDDAGNVTGVIEHVRDITARKQAEDALQESEERFRLFADMTPAILLIYQDNRYIYANRAAEDITGYSRSELYQEDPWFLIHPDYRDYIKGRVLARQTGERIPSATEIKIVVKGGEERWMAMTSATITYQNRPAGIVVAFDVTERKLTALELEEAKSRAELYLDLITHDINNMNQIGIGYLEMLIRSPRLGGRERELLAKSVESLESSTRLIQNVQKLQQVRSGDLRNQQIDVGQVLDEVKSHYLHARGGDRVEYSCAPGCKVQANGLLFDVFSNLVGNAIKHTAQNDEPVVRVVAEKTEDRGQAYCKVIVEDRGQGIPDELKPRIFDRLRRGATKAGGKGLGLYLVKSLVESYRGRVWVEDRVPGDHTKGSRFVVMLPSAAP